MAYTTIDDPEANFQTVIYTGNGSANHAITLGGDTNMQPDFVWIKNRDAADSHCLFDAVRGATKVLHADATTAEVTDTDTLDSFTSDGFQVDADVKVNTNAEKYVAWCWKGANGTATNTSGDKDSTVSVNTAAGISIVKWENDTDEAISIGHGLGAIPDAVIVKELGDAVNWHGRFKGFAANDYISLNNTEAKGASTAVFATLPTSALFYTGTAAYHINANLIAYCFTSIQGFSKIGTYEGNGNADGTFVYTGFKPAFVMTKSVDSTSSWEIFDNKREGYNVDNDALVANDNIVEATADQIDILSNGFKCRIATDPNVAETYIYMAFAEAPLVNSEGVPCNAR